MSTYTKGIKNPKRVYRARVVSGLDDFELHEEAHPKSCDWYLEIDVGTFVPEAGPISGCGAVGQVMIQVSADRMPVDIDHARAYLRALCDALDEEHGR